MELVVAGECNKAAAGDTERVEDLDGRRLPDLDVGELAEVRHHVELDALVGAGQHAAPHQQDDENGVRKQSSEVHDLHRRRNESAECSVHLLEMLYACVMWFESEGIFMAKWRRVRFPVK